MNEDFTLSAIKLASRTFSKLREEAKRAVAEDFPTLDPNTHKMYKTVLREYVAHMVLLYKEESKKLAFGQLKRVQGIFYEVPEEVGG